jgi:hypothetical protein
MAAGGRVGNDRRRNWNVGSHCALAKRGGASGEVGANTAHVPGEPPTIFCTPNKKRLHASTLGSSRTVSCETGLPRLNQKSVRANREVVPRPQAFAPSQFSRGNNRTPLSPAGTRLSCKTMAKKRLHVCPQTRLKVGFHTSTNA